MTQSQMHMAFVASDRLQDSFDQYLQALQAKPDGNHAVLLEPIIDHFLDEVMEAYFHGPIKVVQAEGAVVNIILGVVKVIHRSARSLAGRLVSRTSPAEQKALAQHFQQLRIERDGDVFVSVRLDPGLANRMVLVFDSFSADQGDMSQLTDVMKGMSAAAIGEFLDDTLACLRLGAFNRGVTKTARATIYKSAYMAIDKALPVMEPEHRKPIISYFRNMLLEV